MISKKVKISEMIVASPLTGEELVQVVQDGVNKKVRAAELLIPGPTGSTGLSTYQIAVNHGFVGTEAEWLKTMITTDNLGVVVAPLDENGKIPTAYLPDTSGTVSISKYLTLTTSWQDTGIICTDLDSGSFIMQLIANDSSVGGGHVNEIYTAVMSWYQGTTGEESSDEIVLTRAGGGTGGNRIYLRVMRTVVGVLKLQIASSANCTWGAKYDFKFRRMI